MSFIKLTDARQDRILFVNPDQITIMVQIDAETVLELAAGDNPLFVNETPEQIAELTSAAFETDLPISWSDWGRLQEFLQGLYEDKAYVMPAERLNGGLS